MPFDVRFEELDGNRGNGAATSEGWYHKNKGREMCLNGNFKAI